MLKKYEFTNETTKIENYLGNFLTLHRIKALKDFGDVHKGDLGGWLEKESNLSQEGDCWVYDNAMVYNDARVYDDAQVYGNAWVGDNAQVFGHAQVHGFAQVFGHAKVYDEAQVHGFAWVCNNSVVCGDTKVLDD